MENVDVPPVCAWGDVYFDTLFMQLETVYTFILPVIEGWILDFAIHLISRIDNELEYDYLYCDLHKYFGGIVHLQDFSNKLVISVLMACHSKVLGTIISTGSEHEDSSAMQLVLFLCKDVSLMSVAGS